ncbi:2-polyprenyl-3-methyl-6-methoxy-1,4-benzoquinone monooxygenase [Spartinivicinus poritis]|uniref:3-demethoxyubiquinol 3-hydroxylase n=1 Tax=Spartinivicinus poritis TaxID=2994640 RepID=A0ABT5U9Z7_9GAMM|nr:2-polyprenyl-3-methyl-6-methoxy-1,4-benzoquinone monooxygenase [Spartinivicinus sp. A2-2]MDE1463205.1 2-polyprenyl-3-methyl-6-methoxy-1,4-benzoquinone monooxygenase [Spartinivicinus sp. A2-2]
MSKDARRLSILDKFISQSDQVLRTLNRHAHQPSRPSPAAGAKDDALSELEQRHAAGLMRVNHSGEVCAQALYQGQGLTAKLPDVREEMEQAAQEEVDHLAWCEERLEQLNSRPSLLNPVWYGLSFSIGALAGALGDKWSLGFVAATENQVCKHLSGHLQSLPVQDTKSRAIVEQMLVDEASHEEKALAAGGINFPKPIKLFMTATSKLMTKTAYHI